jgi:hypothetical protein
MLYYAVSNLWGGLNVMYYYLLYLCTLLFYHSIYVFYLLVFINYELSVIIVDDAGTVTAGVYILLKAMLFSFDGVFCCR